jgi:hypothetical protein
MTISAFCFFLSIEYNIYVPKIGVGFTLLVKIFFIFTRGQDDIETTVKLLEKCHPFSQQIDTLGYGSISMIFVT